MNNYEVLLVEGKTGRKERERREEKLRRKEEEFYL